MLGSLLVLTLLVPSPTPIADAVARIQPSEFAAPSTEHRVASQPLLAERVPVRKERVLLKVCMAFNVAGQGYDGATTAKALRSGRFREGNPALRWIGKEPSRIWPVKAGYAAGTTWGFIELAENHPRIAALAACASGAISTWAGGRNRRKLEGR